MALTAIEKVILLQNVDVFSGLRTDHLAHLAAITEEVSFLEGTDIYREADPADALYVVIEGKVRLHRSDQEISAADEKEAFGTWALFDREPRVVTATVVEDARLLRIDRDDFFDLLADHVQITQGLLETIVKRFRSLLKRVENAHAGTSIR